MEFETLRLPAQVIQLEQAQAYLAACAGRCGFDARRAARLAVALEEVFVNICDYAYPQHDGTVELRCRADADDFVLEIADRGIAFDADSLPAPDLGASIEQRRVGGLGWYLVRQMTDAIDCRHEDGRNVVRMIVHRAGPSAPARPA